MTKKISIFLIIIALIITIVPAKTYASWYADRYMPKASIFDNVINPDGYKVPMDNEAPELWNIVNTILGVIQVLGSIISVGALMVIGIKYMLGSLEEKAQYKETMGPYIIGMILLFAGVNILKIIVDIVTKVLK